MDLDKRISNYIIVEVEKADVRGYSLYEFEHGVHCYMGPTVAQLESLPHSNTPHKQFGFAESKTLPYLAAPSLVICLLLLSLHYPSLPVHVQCHLYRD